MSTPKSPRNNQEQDELVELTGCESWEQVEEWFSGMSASKIEKECNKCWPYDNNKGLADRIYSQVR